MSAIDRLAYMKRDHYIYRLLGKGGRVLYVGCSSRPEGRIAEHRRGHGWGHLIHKVETEGPFTYADARALERRRIEEKPGAYNTEWTPKHHRGRLLNLPARSAA